MPFWIRQSGTYVRGMRGGIRPVPQSIRVATGLCMLPFAARALLLFRVASASFHPVEFL
jgi:hypothetical protein